MNNLIEEAIKEQNSMGKGMDSELFTTAKEESMLGIGNKTE